MSNLSKSIDALADVVPDGHLIVSLNGADLIDAATRHIKDLEAEVAEHKELLSYRDRDIAKFRKGVQVLTTELHEARADLAAARATLQRISLGSQNSTEDKTSLGKLARTALAALPTTPDPLTDLEKRVRWLETLNHVTPEQEGTE